MVPKTKYNYILVKLKDYAKIVFIVFKRVRKNLLINKVNYIGPDNNNIIKNIILNNISSFSDFKIKILRLNSL